MSLYFQALTEAMLLADLDQDTVSTFFSLNIQSCRLSILCCDPISLPSIPFLQVDFFFQILIIRKRNHHYFLPGFLTYC